MKLDGKELAKRLMHQKDKKYEAERVKKPRYDDEGEEIEDEISERMDAPEKLGLVIKHFKENSPEEAHRHLSEYFKEHLMGKRAKPRDSQQEYDRKSEKY